MEWSYTRRSLTPSPLKDPSTFPDFVMGPALLGDDPFAVLSISGHPRAHCFKLYAVVDLRLCPACHTRHVPPLDGSSDSHPSRVAAPRRITLAIRKPRSTRQQKPCRVSTLLWGEADLSRNGDPFTSFSWWKHLSNLDRRPAFGAFMCVRVAVKPDSVDFQGVCFQSFGSEDHAQRMQTRLD